MLRELKIKNIRIDGDTQVRVELNQAHVNSLTDDIERGDELPPILVYYDGSDYWLVEGFHRYFAAIAAGKEVIQCQLENGSRDTAIWDALPANRTYGLRRTNADIANACRMAVRHPRAAEMTDRDIASHLGVSHTTVANYRKAESVSETAQPACEATQDKSEDEQTCEDAQHVSPKSLAKFAKNFPKPIVQNATQEPETQERPARADADLPRSQGDDDGNEVPPDLLDVFEARAEFSRMVRQTNELSVAITSMANQPAGRYLVEEAGWCANKLKLIADLIANATPSVVAPVDGGFLPVGGKDEIP